MAARSDTTCATMRFVLLLLPLLLLPRPAAAWLREGHLATGAIAYDALHRRDPGTIATVERLMAAHPDRARFDAALAGLEGEARARLLFALMATWADEVRGTGYDHDDWHWSQAFVSPLRHLVPFAFGGGEDAYRRNLAVARDPAAAAADRALALTWVFHILGDMHQPLHAALWIGWRFPLSDAGGNWAWVRATQGGPPLRLHYWWDSAGRRGAPQRPIPDGWIAELQRRYPFEDEPPVRDAWRSFDAWVGESRALAASAVYEHGAFRPGVSAADAPVLTPGYVARTEAVGAERVAQAGNRLARVLLGLPVSPSPGAAPGR